MGKQHSWDTELYEAQHSFVWKMGASLLAELQARPGERILDLGCGTGQLTSAIAEAGATVLGLDSSTDMIGQARQNYPRLRFALQDAAEMTFENEFDAIFSNAALHWMLDASKVAAGMARALKLGGRLVAELGGRGNIFRIESTVQEVVARYRKEELTASRYYFPTVGEYAKVLESVGFEVRSAALFDRPTPLEGATGMEQWIRQFALFYFEPLSTREQDQAMDEVLSTLRPMLWDGERWIADYRRLRIIAVKL